MTGAYPTAEENQRRRTLGLLLRCLPPEEDPAPLRARLPERLPDTAPDPDPAPRDDAAALAAAGAVRDALAAARPSGLAALTGAARAAGALDDGLARDLLDRARPARALPAYLGGTPAPGTRAAALLRELAARHLGADPARWLGLHDALAAHRGTLPELLAAAPAPAAVPAPPPKSVPATVGLLLEHADPGHAAAALTRLPDTTLRELLSGGSLPGPGLTAAVTGHGDRRARLALAVHPRLDARVLKRLAAADDPAVNAAVYRNPRCTPSLRRAIALRDPEVPLDPGLREELLTTATGRTLLAPLLACGDPALAARALTVGQRRVAQRYALLRVWERNGPGAVRRMLADPEVSRYLHTTSVAADVAAALDEPDGAARLRAAGEPYEDPATLPRLLAASRGTSTLRDLLNEPYAHDFPALAAANRRAPFMPLAAEELLRHEDGTDADRAEFRLSLLNDVWPAGGRRGGNLTPPAERIAAEPLTHSAADWAVAMANAGLLDPAHLLAARPARPAAAALHGVLDARPDLAAAAKAALRAAVREHLSGHPEAWAVLLRLLPDFTGTLPELITVSDRIAGPRQAAPPAPAPAPEPPPAPPADPPPADPPAEPPPATPRTPLHRAALAAADLLIRLADTPAPPGAAPGVLSFLADHDGADTPGWATPDWLIDAHRAAGLTPPGPWLAAPGRQAVLDRLARPHDDRAPLVAERAYLHGVITPGDLSAAFPARALLGPPHDWRRLAFPVAWRRDLAELLHRELGTDPDAWLRLAAAARPEALHPAAERGGATWPELLARSRAAGTPDPAELAPVDRGSPERSWNHTAAPTTPEEALRLLDRGNHLWLWPAGTLLCLARPEVVAAVLPRLGPAAPWTLAAYLLRQEPPPDAAFDHLLALRDPAALRVLAGRSPLLPAAHAHRLLDLADPDTALAVLRNDHRTELFRRVAAAPGPVAARLAAEPPGGPPPGGTAWLHSAEPDLIERVLRHGRLDLPAQLHGCLGLLRHGGPGRLAALVEDGVPGAAVTRLAHKALTGPGDPAAVLRARLEREHATPNLLRRLRRSPHRWTTARLLDDLPADPDWPALEAEHAHDPVPHWATVVNHPRTPEDVRLRHARHLPAPTRRAPAATPAAALARLRHGLGDHHHEPLAVQLDHLLGTGRLTGRDLAREVAPAALVLAWVGGALRRADAPPGARAAAGEVAALVRRRLGGDPDAWQRTYRRLTGRDPDWDPVSPVPALLAP
ncbi:hypothetical protein GCM10027168_24890 [Streptomyces capparidis]